MMEWQGARGTECISRAHSDCLPRKRLFWRKKSRAADKEANKKQQSQRVEVPGQGV